MIHQTDTIDSPHLRILVFGAGAIGTYIGGSLALSGHTVVFLERPKLADLLAVQGLSLELPDGKHRIDHPQMVSSLKQALSLGDYDIALFAVKSYDTHSLLSTFSDHLKSIPSILCLQNGIENEPAIEKLLGKDHVIAGTLTSAVGKIAPGHIVLERLRGIGIADGHPLSTRIAQACGKARLNPQLFPNAADMKWSKMLTNLVANATSAILDMTPAEIFSHPGLYKLEIRQLNEALAVMKKARISVINLPKTPARLLAVSARYLPVQISRPLLARAVGSGRGGKMPSFYIDLQSGRGKSEVEYLNGAVDRFGKKYGIPTPVNHILTDVLMRLTRGELSRDEFRGTPDTLIQMCEV